jgi:hypothetical protein
MSSNSLVPADEPPVNDGAERASGCGQSSSSPHREGRRRPQEGRILSADDCLRMLAQLPKLIVTREMRPAEANAARAVLQGLLADARRREDAGPAPVLKDNVIQSLRDMPDLLEFLAPSLTPEQLARIVGGVDEDP